MERQMNLCNIRYMPITIYTLKTPGSKPDPEMGHWGQTPFRVNDDPDISQHDAEYDPELGQFYPIVCQVSKKADRFPGHR